MDSDRKSQCCKSVETDPLVWIQSFRENDCGRPLFKKQKIMEVMKRLNDDPSIGMASPIIPGKAPNQIPDFEDISIIGAQNGVIMTTTASIPDGAMEVVLLVREKLAILERANERLPGLAEEILGIKQSRFNNIAKQIREIRNRLAHPHARPIHEDDLDLTGIPQRCRRYARLLLKWDSFPYRGAIEEAPPAGPNNK
jgi:hypothetical protein